jgi:hypothetical protein
MTFHHLKNVPPWEWPDTAHDLLITGLLDPRSSDEDLELAAELASETVVMSDRLADALLHLLVSSERSEPVRSQAAIALGPALEDADINEFDQPEEISISEEKFNEIKRTLRALFGDQTLPVSVRRSVLEASVRSPEQWHEEAIRQAYASPDRSWKLTAVFCMRFVRGFETEILAELESSDPEILFEAVRAAGSWELGGAWKRVRALLSPPTEDKPLLLAAIAAVAAIRPDEIEILKPLKRDRDRDIAEAVEEAEAMAQAIDEIDRDDDPHLLN